MGAEVALPVNGSCPHKHGLITAQTLLRELEDLV
jgi:hypothetical protein